MKEIYSQFKGGGLIGYIDRLISNMKECIDVTYFDHNIRIDM